MRQGSFVQTINCFLHANNATYYVDVIELSKNDRDLEKLIEYLIMARKIKKESIIDNELAFCYAYQDNH
jgi:clathrin heavy chain